MNSIILHLLQETRPESDFTSSSDFIADGLLDSFDLIVLISELEDAFNVSIDGGSIIAKNFISLDSISNLINTSKKLL